MAAGGQGCRPVCARKALARRDAGRAEPPAPAQPRAGGGAARAEGPLCASRGPDLPAPGASRPGCGLFGRAPACPGRPAATRAACSGPGWGGLLQGRKPPSQGDGPDSRDANKAGSHRGPAGCCAHRQLPALHSPSRSPTLKIRGAQHHPRHPNTNRALATTPKKERVDEASQHPKQSDQEGQGWPSGEAEPPGGAGRGDEKGTSHQAPRRGVGGGIKIFRS